MADTPTLPKQGSVEIGNSGTYNTGGFITGEEYNRDLIGHYGLQVFDVMRKSDSTVHATLMVCKNPIIGATWDLEAASDDEADLEIAAFVKSELMERKIQFQEAVREALTCLDFGYYIAEKVFEPIDYNGAPRIGLAKLASRKQRSIMKFSIHDGKDPGVTQVIAVAGRGVIEIPRNKLVYVINEREGENWTGISLLRFAYKPWKIKESLEIMHAIGLEQMARGIPVLRKGQNNMTTTEGELEKARTALRQLRANEEGYLELPDSIDVEMLDLKAQGTKDVLPTITYLDRQITLSVLAQFLELGASGGGGSGSRAVSADHSALFTKSLEAVARTIQQAFQTDIVNQLVDLNYSDLKNGYPRLVYSNISDDNVTDTSNAVSALMQAGALHPDEDVENRLRGILNLPELKKDDYDNYDELTPTPQPTDPNTTTPAKGKPTSNKTNVDKINKDKTKTDSSVIAAAQEIQQQLLDNILAG